MTDILQRRTYEHKHGLIEGFTKRYNLKNWFTIKLNLIYRVQLKEKTIKELA